MTPSKYTKISSFGLMGVGILLCFLPLYAFLFTVEAIDSDVLESTEGAPRVIASKKITVMHVPPWIPLVGGVMSLAGGILYGVQVGISRGDKG